MTGPWRLVGAALTIYAAVVGLALAHAGGNPEWFIHFGTQSTVIGEGRHILGPHVLIPHTQGQDGQTFWLMARDPLLLHPAVEKQYEDRPAYRSQRVLYPLLAAPARVFGERPLVWALLLLNFVAIAFGTYWAAVLAATVRAPRRLALAFTLNPAVVIAVLMDASDALALALVVCGLALWLRRHRRDLAWAAVAFALAALAKEVTVLVPLALGAAELVRRRPRRAVAVAAPSVLAVGAWAVYVRVRLGWPPTHVQEFAWPFDGFWQAFQRGWRVFGNWDQGAIALACLALMVVVLAAWLRWRDDLLLAAVPFALLFPFLSAQVLDLGVNSARATGPALSLVAIAIAAHQRRPTSQPA
jgi:hypothetical protein